MKSWWYSINIFILLSSFIACPSRQPAEVRHSVDVHDSVAILQDTMSKDGVVSVLDSVPPSDTIIHKDGMSKDDKYGQRDGDKKEAPKHATPDPDKLDSAKKKEKKK